MMKKLLLLVVALCPMSVLAATVIVYEDPRYKVFDWSYGALAETMREMRDRCEPTDGEPFVKIGNWMREKKAKFSITELIQKCKEAGFKDIDRTRTDTASDKVAPSCELPDKKCRLDGTTRKYNCGEEKLSGISGCDIFLETFRTKSNDRAEKLQDRKPGTYVSKVKDGVYQVVDVVLADGYWIRDDNDKPKYKEKEKSLNPYLNANMTVNTDEKNTKIWEITQDGKINDTLYHTWTNDMFLGITAAPDVAGRVSGALAHSFIFTKRDVTKDVYDNIMAVGNKATDAWTYLVESTKLFDNTDSIYDPKIYFPKKYPDLTSQQYYSEYEGKMRPQKETDVHSNGVIFEGKVAMLDWLGNLMVGLNFEKIAQRPQDYDGWVPELLKKGIKSAGADAAQMAQVGVDLKQTLSKALSEPKKLKDFELRSEPYKAQQAWDLGEHFFANGVTPLYKYEELEIVDPYNALVMAEDLILDTFGVERNVVNCDVSCDRPHAVYCTVDTTNRRTVLVKFGRICAKEVYYDFNATRVTPAQAIVLVNRYNAKNKNGLSACKSSEGDNRVECSDAIFQFADISTSNGSKSNPYVAKVLCEMWGGMYKDSPQTNADYGWCEGLTRSVCEGQYKADVQLASASSDVRFYEGDVCVAIWGQQPAEGTFRKKEVNNEFNDLRVTPAQTKEMNNEFDSLHVTPSQAVALVYFYNRMKSANMSGCEHKGHQVECSEATFSFANISDSNVSKSYPYIASALCKLRGGNYMGDNVCDGISKTDCQGDYKNVLQELIQSSVGVEFVQGLQFGKGACVVKFK